MYIITKWLGGEEYVYCGINDTRTGYEDRAMPAYTHSWKLRSRFSSKVCKFSTLDEANYVRKSVGGSVIDITPKPPKEREKEKDLTLQRKLVDYLTVNNIMQKDFGAMVGLTGHNVGRFIRHGFQRGLAKERIEEFFKEKENDND